MVISQTLQKTCSLTVKLPTHHFNVSRTYLSPPPLLKEQDTRYHLSQICSALLCFAHPVVLITSLFLFSIISAAIIGIIINIIEFFPTTKIPQNWQYSRTGPSPLFLFLVFPQTATEKERKQNCHSLTHSLTPSESLFSSSRGQTENPEARTFLHSNSLDLP